MNKQEIWDDERTLKHCVFPLLTFGIVWTGSRQRLRRALALCAANNSAADQQVLKVWGNCMSQLTLPFVSKLRFGRPGAWSKAVKSSVCRTVISGHQRMSCWTYANRSDNPEAGVVTPLTTKSPRTLKPPCDRGKLARMSSKAVPSRSINFKTKFWFQSSACK